MDVVVATKGACDGDMADVDGIIPESKRQSYRGMLPMTNTGILGLRMNPHLFRERTAALWDRVHKGESVLLSDILRAAGANEYIPPVDVLDLQQQVYDLRSRALAAEEALEELGVDLEEERDITKRLRAFIRLGGRPGDKAILTEDYKSPGGTVWKKGLQLSVTY